LSFRARMRGRISHRTLFVLSKNGASFQNSVSQMDNAGNNDTMLKAVSRILREDHSIKYDHRLHRIRCQGHIINLAVHSVLFVTDSENLEDETLCAKGKNDALKAIEGWRKKGPLGKLHNFIVYLQASVQRLQDFLRISKGRRLARDNTTR
jgi:hypothetical protein